MKRTAVTTFFILGSLFTLVANEEATYLVPQPLVGFGDDLESSGRRGVVAPFPSNQNFDRRETKGGVNYC